MEAALKWNCFKAALECVGKIISAIFDEHFAENNF